MVLEVVARAERPGLLVGHRHPRRPRRGLDLRPYDGEARAGQPGGRRVGGGAGRGQGAVGAQGQHRLGGYAATVEDDMRELPGPLGRV
ncbi:hypothetical protein AB4212_22640, partial [Streptomyces sp. 2MCAF27]